MSRTMHLGCKTCHEQIWIGQNNAFYSAMPEVMEGLQEFLNKHKTDWMYTDVEHVLTYEPELYGEEWTELDTDQFKPTQEPK